MVDQTAAKADFKEVATTRDGRDITRPYVDALAQLQPQDRVLQLRGGGNYEIYREVLRDDHVASTFGQRRLAVVSREWQVDAGGDKRIDKKAADFLREQLKAIDWDDITDKMLFGRFYGYAVGECLYARDGAQVVLDELRVRDRRRFAFDGDYRLRLMTTSNMVPGELLPDRKFWHFNVGADHDDDPYGLGLAHWLYWPTLFKRNGIKFWLIFLEKFGQPTGLGKYPVGAQPEEKQKLLNALDAIRTDAGIIVPDGMAIELLEAARSGTADYTALYDRMNQAIARVVLGQTLSSEAQSTGLGSGTANVHNEVRLEAVKADADLVCNSFNAQVARWLTEWNFPGAAIPRVWRVTEEPADINAEAERDVKLSQLGYYPSAKRIEEVYGDGYERREPTLPNPSQPGGMPTNPDPTFAEGVDLSVADRQAQLLGTHADPAVGGWVDQIRQLVDESQSLEEIRDRLMDLYPNMSLDQYATAMQQALSAAELAGRADVMDEASGHS